MYITAFSFRLYNFKTAGIKFGVHDGILDHDSDQDGPSFESLWCTDSLRVKMRLQHVSCFYGTLISATEKIIVVITQYVTRRLAT